MEPNYCVEQTINFRARGKKRGIKGIAKVVMVGLLLTATILSTAVTANAAEMNNYDNPTSISQYDQSSIANTLSALVQAIEDGSISNQDLVDLADKLGSMNIALDDTATNDLQVVAEYAQGTNLSDKTKGVLQDFANEVGYTVTSTVRENEAPVAVATSFSDVTSNQWYYDAIMKAVSLNMFSGTTTPVNGVGTFAPTKTMTCAEFVTVVMRTVAPGSIQENNGDWWSGAYEGALEIGLLDRNDFNNGDMSKPMQRQEMAYVLANAMEYKGESLDQNISKSRIPDFNSVGNKYQDEVLVAYSNGLLAGTDTSGTFSPTGVLTRAEGATVLVRLADATDRKDVMSDSEYYADKSEQESATSITITEGAVREGRPAQVGDTVIKADGTSVVLAIGPNGVLGEGQGVAPNLGLKDSNGTPLQAGMSYYNDISYKDSFGNKINNDDYTVNPITGSGHWGQELNVLLEASKPATDGAFLYELSADHNMFWDGMFWANCFNITKDSAVDTIKDANGI